MWCKHNDVREESNMVIVTENNGDVIEYKRIG